MTLFKYSMKKVIKYILILCSILITFLTANNITIKVNAEETNSTYIYNLKEKEDITRNVSFQSDYFTFEKTKLHALPYARSYDDLLSNEFLGQNKTLKNENTDLHYYFDSETYSAYTLTFNHANSHIYFNENPSNIISFYLPSFDSSGYKATYYETLFNSLDIEEIALPYIAINGKRYVSLYYSATDGFKLLLENYCSVSEEKFNYTGEYGGIFSDYFYRLTIPYFNEPKIFSIDILDIGYQSNVVDTESYTNTWEEFDIRFIPHSSMDDIMISMPFEIKSFDIEKELPEIIIDYSTFTGIVNAWGSITNWNYQSLDLRLSPSEWAFCSSATFSDGHVSGMNPSLYDINLLLTENKDYYDENGVLHKSEESNTRLLDTTIDHSYAAPGGSKYSGGIIDGLDIEELKLNKSYGTIKINDLSFYVYLTNLNNAYIDEDELITLDFSNVSSVYYTYDSRPKIDTYCYQFDDYLMTSAGARIDNVYLGFGDIVAFKNLFELIGTAIEGAINVMQVYGFDFYFDEDKLLPIDNVQSIKFDFLLDGKRYQKIYTETETSDFARFFLNGYDDLNNILTDHDSWPRVCERIDDQGEEKIFDYALVHHVGNKRTGKYIKELDVLEITYLTEDFSLKQAVSNDLGLHEVDGKLYDKDGNLRLDYTLKEVELTDDNGNTYTGTEIVDKDGNIVKANGEKIETTSKNPIDNLVDGKYDDLFKSFGESFEKILMIIGILILVVIIGFFSPIFSVIFNVLIKCISWAFKGIIMIISAPFKLIGNLFKPKKRKR